jgi:hypothetical protein
MAMSMRTSVALLGSAPGVHGGSEPGSGAARERRRYATGPGGRSGQLLPRGEPERARPETGKAVRQRGVLGEAAGGAAGVSLRSRQ